MPPITCQLRSAHAPYLAVKSAGYDTPMEVVDAYLKSPRTPLSSRSAPGSTSPSTTFESSTTTTRSSTPACKETAGPTGTLKSLRVAQGNAEVWVVTQAFVVSLKVPSMTYRDGTLAGAPAAGPHSTNVYVRDAITGEVLDEQRYPLFPPNRADQPPGTPIESSGLSAATCLSSSGSPASIATLPPPSSAGS